MCDKPGIFRTSEAGRRRRSLHICNPMCAFSTSQPNARGSTRPRHDPQIAWALLFRAAAHKLDLGARLLLERVDPRSERAMARHHFKRGPDERPAVDEWGIYDPSQAGLEALVQRLDTKRGAVDNDGRRVSFKIENRLADALARDLARKR